ncbi:26256_t:CDS:2 [Gigaspora margarita]|uniref:26256_t:CDS:1 n=1 Tax=Gigaspora margarita TaxID=4874 RepID=A0ABM8VZS8_GIGMA|nr:26256_t:CDS:2 [Gigaspora margarita]
MVRILKQHDIKKEIFGSTTLQKLLEHTYSQDDKTLATWSQLKLIKGATRKGRKPIWFEYLESIVLQDSATRKIKDDFYTSTDLRGLAIPNLQCLAGNRRIKDWVIAKKIDSEPIVGHTIKKNSNSVLIEHWKELDHLVPSQSKLEKCRNCSLSTNPTQDSCTLRISKGKILGVLPKAVVDSASKMTKIKIKLWQGGKNEQQSNPESPFLGLKDIEYLKIDLIQKQ